MADIGDLTGVVSVQLDLNGQPPQVVTAPLPEASVTAVATSAPPPPVIVQEMAPPRHPLPHSRRAPGSLPPISYAVFLPTLADQAQRQSLWQTLQAAMSVAQTFVPGKTLDIHSAEVQPLRSSVSATYGEGSWHSRGGVIKLEQHPGSTAQVVIIEPGVLLHETFHPTFYLSPFQDQRHGGTDHYWAEAWCDAFRYCAGMTILPDTPSELTWRPGAAAYSQTHTKAQVLTSKSGWACLYRYPASLIINKAGGTLAGLEALWAQLLRQKHAAKGASVMDKFFGYSPRHPSGAQPANNPTAPGTSDSPPQGSPAAVKSAAAGAKPVPASATPRATSGGGGNGGNGGGAGLAGAAVGAAAGFAVGNIPGAVIGAIAGLIAGNAASGK